MCIALVFIVYELGYRNEMVLNIAHGMIAISTEFEYVLLLRPVCANFATSIWQ
jgi:hypothetical protein